MAEIIGLRGAASIGLTLLRLAAKVIVNVGQASQPDLQKGVRLKA
jgi:hypothetical protein